MLFFFTFPVRFDPFTCPFVSPPPPPSLSSLMSRPNLFNAEKQHVGYTTQVAVASAFLSAVTRDALAWYPSPFWYKRNTDLTFRRIRNQS